MGMVCADVLRYFRVFVNPGSKDVAAFFAQS